MSAIVAPQNLPKAEACAKEEIERAVKEGFTDQEVKEAIKGILDSRAVNRAQDDYLAQSRYSLWKRARRLLSASSLKNESPP